MSQKINLWHDQKSAGTGNAADDFQPYLELSLIADAHRPLGAVIVLPGGGYCNRAPHEGMPVAERFNQLGFHSFCLQYRVAPYSYPAPQQDVARAVALVRANAAKWNVDPEHIAVGGFSAGGHLACCSGTIALDVDRSAGDEADQASARPDALILCYPVITADTVYSHQGSVKNLAGTEEPSDEIRALFSLENQIRPETPPAFLWHTATDQAVNVENSIRFARTMWQAEKRTELHIFPEGRHGLGLAPDCSDISQWPELAAAFLENLNFPRFVR